jgi:amino acid permease-like protein
MAIAGSAPAYSITVSTAALVAATGVAGPAALWIAALPIIGIAVAFAYLNRWRPDAGAAYVWVGRAMHPALGFLAGWSLLSLSTIFNVAAALPAGQATLDLFAADRSHDVGWVASTGAAWFLGVLALITFGITVSAKRRWFSLCSRSSPSFCCAASRFLTHAPCRPPLFPGIGFFLRLPARSNHFRPECWWRFSFISAGTCPPTSRKRRLPPIRPRGSLAS